MPPSTHEEELRKVQPVLRRLVRFGLLGKSVAIRGGENFRREGPLVLIGNHCGAFKDVATLFRVAPRPIFFNANKRIFSRAEFSALTRKHLKRHLGRLGVFFNFLINPFKFLFVDYVSSHIARVGTIPVDLGGGDKREAIERCMDYLRRGRAIVSLQGRGRVDPKERNPYVKPFGRGSSIIACRLHLEERLDVPIVPLALYGTHLPWAIPGQIRVNFGPPMFARDYLAGGLEASVEKLRSVLEAAVHGLFLELLRG